MTNLLLLVILLLCTGLAPILICVFILREFVTLQIGLYHGPLEWKEKKK